MKIPAWSFSSIKTFDQCPKKYYHLKVLRDFKDPPTEATMYGTEFHKAAEEYIRDGTPIPPQFSYAKSALDNLNQMAGEKHCELQMALTEDLEVCAFDADNVWWRGIADLVIINKETGEAKVIDYKTGKSAKYADKGQLELMALAIFKHFPEVKKVKGGLLFVVCKVFIKENYTQDQAHVYWQKWLRDYDRMKSAYINNVWNTRPSGLCRKHCAVEVCPHNGRNF